MNGTFINAVSRISHGIFAQGPRWLEFGLRAKTMIANKIASYKEQVIQYRRHYKQDIKAPVYVDTYALFPMVWLWTDWTIGGLGDHHQPWSAVQQMLREEFPQYTLTFSRGPTQEFIIPGVSEPINKTSMHFWVKIDSKERPRNTSLGRSMYFSTGTLSKDEMEDRVIGVLFGQAVGDALGTRYEFSTATAAARAVERDTQRGHLPILGGGPFQLAPGQITDDTELALVLARRICILQATQLHHSRFGDFARTEQQSGLNKATEYNIAKGFVDWYLSGPFDIGNATRTAFSGISPTLDPAQIHAKMLANAQQNMNSLSNGCLMKTSPIALVGVLPVGGGDQIYLDTEVADFGGEICKLTNPNPIAIDAVKVYIYSIRQAIHGNTQRNVWKKAMIMAKTPTVKEILEVAAERAPEQVDGNQQGYLGIALQLAFYELLCGESFEASLTRTVARGGDTDTNGCIVGALLGAFYGYSRIPDDWRKAVLTVNNPRTRELPEAATRDLLILALALGYTD